jgi:hypothetical protein
MMLKVAQESLWQADEYIIFKLLIPI